MNKIIPIGIGVTVFAIVVSFIMFTQSQKAPYDSNEIKWCFNFINSDEYHNWKKDKDEQKRTIEELNNYEPKFTYNNYRIKMQKMEQIVPRCNNVIDYASKILG
jgi:flagellar basal body-associated protein FliL